MEQEETIDYNIRKTWYNITKMYNRTAIEYMGSMALAMILLNIDSMKDSFNSIRTKYGHKPHHYQDLKKIRKTWVLKGLMTN